MHLKSVMCNKIIHQDVILRDYIADYSHTTISCRSTAKHLNLFLIWVKMNYCCQSRRKTPVFLKFLTQSLCVILQLNDSVSDLVVNLSDKFNSQGSNILFRVFIWFYTKYYCFLFKGKLLCLNDQ